MLPSTNKYREVDPKHSKIRGLSGAGNPPCPQGPDAISCPLNTSPRARRSCGRWELPPGLIDMVPGTSALQGSTEKLRTLRPQFVPETTTSVNKPNRAPCSATLPVTWTCILVFVPPSQSAVRPKMSRPEDTL